MQQAAKKVIVLMIVLGTATKSFWNQAKETALLLKTVFLLGAPCFCQGNFKKSYARS
jgi:hypothetical protein